MFFNKLREEFKEMLAKFAVGYSKSVLSTIQIYNSTIEELKAKYKHTRWSELSPLERDALTKKYNITYALSLNNLFNSHCYYVDSDYISDTLEKLQDIENSKTVEPENKESEQNEYNR